MELYCQPNNAKNGLNFGSEVNRARFVEWMRKYPAFKITPVTEESKESRGYLEGAVVPAYCHWQYNIDPREPGKAEARRLLFKRDFHSEVVEDRLGNPERVPLSSRGEAKNILNHYTRWAEENGAPIPNPDLYKKWKKEWSMDKRWPTFIDWIEALGVAVDGMPSAETLEAFRREHTQAMPDYPTYQGSPTI